MSELIRSEKVEKLSITEMRKVAAGDGFRYFSGANGSCHNLPAVYAWGGSIGGIAVVGRGVDKTFPPGRLYEAFALFKTLLAEQGYPVEPLEEE